MNRFWWSFASTTTTTLVVLSPLLLSSSSSSSCRAFSISPKGGGSNWKEAADEAVKILSNANSVLFVTGAGISAESGLPTYRGVSGLYNDNSDKKLEEGMSIEECLSASTYRRRPDLTWKYLHQIEQSCRGALPSRAHQLVAQTQKYISGRVTVMTQNIDGLHHRAGSSDVLSLHGQLHQLQCTTCPYTTTVSSYQPFEQAQQFPPKCPSCGNQSIRPNVVLFDESLRDDTVQTYQDRLGITNQYTWELPSQPTHDVSVCIGTSALFAYVNTAALSGSKTIEINPIQTPLTSLVDVYIPAGASDSLEYIYQQLGWTTTTTTHPPDDDDTPNKD